MCAPPPSPTAAGTTSNAGASEAITRLLRGSTLLLGGRVLALAADFAAHVLIVRYLTKGDFGAYTLALSVATLLAPTLLLGLPETIARYAPIFLERRQVGRLMGAVGFAAAVVLAAGLACIVVVLAFDDTVAELTGSELTARLLAILVLIVPSDGLNLLFQALFASIGRVRSIFLRQYVLVPGLRLAVAVALVWYASLAAPAIRHQVRNRFSGLEVPAREIMSFALPVFLTNVFWIVLLSFSTIALGVLANTREVADFQAVLPPARLNYLVMSIFFVLFIPTVSRLYAREEFGELRSTYLATTRWQIVLTVPILALTTVFAGTFVPTVFGADYDGSSVILAMLSLAYYMHTAAGPASTTLKVYRRLRYTVVIDSVAIGSAVVLNLILIPIDGARGAALAFLLAVMIRTVPYQLALRRIAGVKLMTREYVRLQALIVLLLAALAVVQVTLDPPLVVAVVLAGAAGLLVAVISRESLHIEDSFPELARGRLGTLVRLSEGRFTRRRRRRD
jgi:O-antigen/teichoic acid export membrane protein